MLIERVIYRHIELSKTTGSTMFFWMIEREVKTEPEKLVRRRAEGIHAKKKLLIYA